MVQRGLCGVNSRSTSQALSSVVEVAQGVFLRTIFAFGFGCEERPLTSCDLSRRLDFTLPVINMVPVEIIILSSYYLCKPHLKSLILVCEVHRPPPTPGQSRYRGFGQYSGDGGGRRVAHVADF